MVFPLLRRSKHYTENAYRCHTLLPGALLAELADDASPKLPSTSHLAIVDAAGNAVAMTTSIEFAFGSRNGPTELERGTSAANWTEPLTALGHEVRLIDMTSGVHGIGRTRTGWSGAADPRREGVAKGD